MPLHEPVPYHLMSKKQTPEEKRRENRERIAKSIKKKENGNKDRV